MRVISLKHWTWELTYIDMTETAEYMRKFWIWVNFCLKKRGERLLLWTIEHVHVWTNENYPTLNFFFQPKIKTYPEITHDSTETMTVQNRSVTRHVIRYTFTLNVISPKCWTWEHVTDCPDDDTAGKDDQSQREIGRRYRREETEQRYAILEYAICMTTLRIVKTIFGKGRVHVLEYAICMTTLCIVKTIFRTRSVHVLEPAICMSTLRIEKTTFRHVVQRFWNA